MEVRQTLLVVVIQNRVSVFSFILRQGKYLARLLTGGGVDVEVPDKHLGSAKEEREIKKC